MRILITGASGFIGSAAVSALLSSSDGNREVIQWNRTMHGNLLVESDRIKVLNDWKPDVVLHFAWHNTSSATYETEEAHNIWAHESYNFAKACSLLGVWFLCAGSAADIEETRYPSHVQDSQYAKSKNRLRRNVMALATEDACITWLRIHYVFSLPQSRPRIVKALLESLDQPHFTPDSPESLFDYTHLDDIASSILTILNHKVTGIIDAGSGRLVSTLNFVETVKYHLGLRRSQPTIDFQPSNYPPSVLREAGWTPASTFSFFGLEDDGPCS